jgi:hypothetical protein
VTFPRSGRFKLRGKSLSYLLDGSVGPLRISTSARTLTHSSTYQSCWVAHDRYGRSVLQIGNCVAFQEFMGKREAL